MTMMMMVESRERDSHTDNREETEEDSLFHTHHEHKMHSSSHSHHPFFSSNSCVYFKMEISFQSKKG